MMEIADTSPDTQVVQPDAPLSWPIGRVIGMPVEAVPGFMRANWMPSS